MSALNSWQRIRRVDAVNPWGDGSNGALTISANTTQSQTVKSCSGTSGTNTLSLASAGFSNGDLVFIHQTRGTGAGQWEINKVSSGGGTATLTLQENLQYTYTDSGASQAQVIKILQYTTVTVDSGFTWSAPTWGGDTGGFLLFAANGAVTINGSIASVGGNASGGTGGSGRGFAGGNGTANGGQAYQGEGTAGAGGQSISANENGGGGGVWAQGGPGGGGGHGAAGAAGWGSTAGGTASGTADLTTLTFGGGGGGGGTDTGFSNHGGGGSGGGGVFIFCDNISFGGSGSITVNGGNAAGGTTIEGGGGAGGAVLIACDTATLGTNKVTGTGGAATSSNRQGGQGAVGRISLHYVTSYTGTTNPTLDTTFDPDLNPPRVPRHGFVFHQNPGIV